MKKVRALQDCFVGNSLRKIGAEFYVDDDQMLRTKKLSPVLELVDAPEAQTAPRRGRPRKPVPEDETPAED